MAQYKSMHRYMGALCFYTFRILDSVSYPQRSFVASVYFKTIDGEVS